MASKHPGTTLIFGGQAGSEGKGAIVGYLARKYDWAAAICSFMTNAGHTWIGEDGTKVVVQQLPMAVVNPDIPFLLLGPGSAITVSQLFKEAQEIEAAGFAVYNRLRIHPRAMIIEDSDAEFEHEHTRYLGSTAKGCGRALARKVMRLQDVRLARDIPELQQFMCDTTLVANTLIDGGRPILIEGSQGFDLDINHGIEYPYCTSRGTTPQQTLADCGIAASVVKEIIATIRSYPIRVGNIVEGGKQIGYSGPFAGKELTWDQITAMSGSPFPLEERTTVTKRVRRIFEISYEQMQQMVRVTRPTRFALTFADYIDDSIRLVTQQDYDAAHGYLPGKVKHFVNSISTTFGIPVSYLKTGPADHHMIEL